MGRDAALAAPARADVVYPNALGNGSGNAGDCVRVAGPVDPGADPNTGPCTLRDALTAALDGDTVFIGPGEYVLAGQFRNEEDLTLQGAGARATALTGRSTNLPRLAA